MEDTRRLYTDLLIATPDVTTETFQQNRTVVTPGTRTGTRDDVDVVFVENVYDPDPDDEQYETTVLYLIRDHGRLRIETDHWTMGLFSAGEDAYTVFACVKT